MFPLSLHDPKRSVFVLVPDKGPLSVLLRVGDPRQVYEAINPLRPALAEARGSRPSPVMLAFSSKALEAVGDENSLDVLLRALGMMGMNCVGFVKDSPQAQDLADMANLLVLEPADGLTHVDLRAHAQVADKKALREEEARAWEEALAIDAEINRARELARQKAQRLKEEEAQAWEEALAIDAEINRARELKRLEAQRLKEEEARDWEEALAMDEQINRAREAARLEAQRRKEEEARDWEEAKIINQIFDKEREAQAWEEALVIDAEINRAREAARLEAQRQKEKEQELRDWEEAIAFDKLFNEAEKAARLARQAVLEGKAPSQAPVDDATLVQAHGEASEEEGEDTAVAVAPRTGAVKTAMIQRERVRSGFQVYARGTDLTVFGNVSSGAEIIADGSIHAYAPVYGRMIAGAQGDKEANIVCRQFFAELVAIGGVFLTNEDLPEDLRGAAVHFWNEDGAIHFRRLAESAPSSLAM